jgi:type IV pilus assembly protein PilB
MDSPLNLAARDEISLRTGYQVVPQVTSEKALNLAILHHFSIENATKQEIVNIRLREIKDLRSGKDAAPEEEEIPQGEEGTVIRLVNTIVKGAIQAGASDIHLEPHEPEMRLRYRVDGILNEIMTIPGKVEKAVVSRIKVMADLDISERRVPQDGHFSVRQQNRNYDFRVSTLPTILGEKVVIRVLDKDSAMVDLGGLGFAGEDRQAFESFIKRPYGIILITGPTGSGKTTTLYAALKSLKSGENNIVTIEDPVEYCLPGTNQVQINNAAGVTFPRTLRTILRQDPDIIMVGEIRDRETAELAVDAALTGHLVFSTLHTNDATGAPVRLTEMGVEPFLIASSVLGVIAQRLVRMICPDCGQPVELDEAELGDLPAELRAGGHVLRQGRGCRFCYQTGYRGRTGVFEILKVNESIQTLIAAKKSAGVIKAAAAENGFRTLFQQGIQKVIDGQTTLSEVKRVIGSEVS